MTADPGIFEAMYRADPDPWGFETSAYESAKYVATLAALPRERFLSALEVGCSIGVFTRLLAPRCDRLLALDVSPTALAAAAARCVDQTQVTFAQRTIPGGWPDGERDLIVLSEVLYFLGPADVMRTAVRAQASLARGGYLLLVNFRGPTDTALSGEAAAALFLRTLTGAPEITTRLAPRYRIDLVRR